MWKKLPLKGFVYFSVISGFISIILIFVLRNYLPPVVPLYYGLPTGAGQLTERFGLIIAPSVSLLITFINIGIATFSKNEFLTKALILASAFVALLITLTTLKIILLIGFF